MHKYIIVSLPADKALALGVVKPLHCSLFYCLFNTFQIVFTLDGNSESLADAADWRETAVSRLKSNVIPS
jgi:hypothetical protein